MDTGNNTRRYFRGVGVGGQLQGIGQREFLHKTTATNSQCYSLSKAYVQNNRDKKRSFSLVVKGL